MELLRVRVLQETVAKMEDALTDQLDPARCYQTGVVFLHVANGIIDQLLDVVDPYHLPFSSYL